MSKFNLTVDDFDPVVRYSNYEDWQTPNPQDNPTWWNATQAVTGSQWNQATYHYTTTNGAQASFNFTGSGLWIYGATGPAASDYTISIDGKESSLQTANATEGRTLLYGTDSLTYAPHELVITNKGSGILLDMIVVEMDLGAEGATITNTTLDDRSADIKFTGDWTQQTGPNFFDQTSTYTGGPNNYFEVNFAGSAVWIYGDQVNDHGLFTVSINGTDVATNNGRSGCGGGWAKYCEKLHGLAFFAGSLPEGTHTLRLTNNGPSEGNLTYFDFDYLQYATPSSYFSASAASANVTGGTSTTSPSGSASSGSAATSSGAATTQQSGAKSAAAASVSGGTGTLALMFGAFLLRKILA